MSNNEELDSLFAESEFTQKRPRENNDEDELLDNLDDGDEDQNQLRTRRLKRKKRGSAEQKNQDEDIEIEGEKATQEIEREENQEGREQETTERNIGSDDEERDVQESTSKLGSKQLQSELFADDSDSENIVSGSELPNDFPDDLSEDEIVGLREEEAARANRQLQEQAYISDEDFSDEERLGDFVVDSFNRPVRVKENQRRLGPGAITSDQLGVALEIFGDYPEDELNEYDEEEYEDENQFSEYAGKTSELRKESYKLLAQRLEPSELEENFASAKDDDIVNTDIPERHQLRTPSREVPDEDSITKEAEWIYDKYFRVLSPPLNLEESVFIICIKNVLKFILVDYLEIPFIASYKKDHWDTSLPNQLNEDSQGCLVASHLWDIYDWDEKWYNFQNKKNKLFELYNSLMDESDEKTRQVLQEYIASIVLVSDPEELNDYFDHFRLHFSQSQNQRSNQKLPSKRDVYSVAKRAGISEFASTFGLSAKEFGENLELQYAKHIPKDPEVSPADMAFVSTNDVFTRQEDLLQATRVFLATEIASEPRVRQHLRSQFINYAVLNTRPTEEGKRIIDPFNSYRSVKHLKDKPVLEIIEFESPTTKFAKILKATKEGLITYSIDLPESDYRRIFDRTKRLYITSVDNEWNIEREKIFDMAFNDYLIPLFKTQLTEKLSIEGQNAVVTICENKLEKLLLAGPFRNNTEDKNQEEEQVTVLACCYGSFTEQKLTECVLLNPGGEYKAHISLTLSPKTKARDYIEFRKFIELHNPTVIAIGTNGYSSSHFYADIMNELKSMRTEGYKVPHVSWVDSEVSEIYWSSQQAKDEYKKLNISKTGVYNPRIARAISIGRRLQDPLMEFARICNGKRDVNCLHLDPLQDVVNSELLYTRLERVFVSIVNAVGVDINELINYPKKSHILSFVAGLGPRKATHILSEISSTTSFIYSRDQLMMFMGEIVGRNAIGFIKINVGEIIKKGAELAIEFLDSTRIHPEDYTYAYKVSKDAIDRNCDFPVEEIMKKPEELNSIDLDMFAELLEKNFDQKKMHVLYDIKNELNHQFSEVREGYVDIEVEHLFDLLTGTTTETFYVGMFVKCRIIMKRDPNRDYNVRGVSCQLEHTELFGWIPTDCLSDDRINDPSEVVQADETVLGRILNIDKKKFRVVITCKPRDLLEIWDPRNPDCKFKPPSISIDKCLLELPSEDYINPALEEKTEEEKEKKVQIFKRAIVHPKFKNIDSKSAEIELSSDTVPVGQILFRPSSSGYTRLSLSWKFFSDIYVHIDITEYDKPNNWSLGKKLRIGEENFDDLDDILANFVDPLVGYAESVFDHRRFKAGRRNEIDAFLGDTKKQSPNDMAYVLAVSYEDPGRFQLCYLPYKKIVREFITVTPKGLRYRKRYFNSAEKVVDYFKRHWNDKH